MPDDKSKLPTKEGTDGTVKKKSSNWGSANDFFKSDNNTPDDAWEKMTKQREEKKLREQGKKNS